MSKTNEFSSQLEESFVTSYSKYHHDSYLSSYVAMLNSSFSSGTFVRDIEVELCFFIRKMDNQSFAAFCAYMH